MIAFVAELLVGFLSELVQGLFHLGFSAIVNHMAEK